jgi:hypothetical protein
MLQSIEREPLNGLNGIQVTFFLEFGTVFLQSFFLFNPLVTSSTHHSTIHPTFSIQFHPPTILECVVSALLPTLFFLSLLLMQA